MREGDMNPLNFIIIARKFGTFTLVQQASRSSRQICCGTIRFESNKMAPGAVAMYPSV